jgi:hypothetical protein
MRSFEEARAFVHDLGLRGENQWRKYCKSGKKTERYTSNPNKTYKNKGWVSWPDWLGTDTVAPQNRQYRVFKEATVFVHELGLASQSEWFEYTKSGQ